MTTIHKEISLAELEERHIMFEAWITDQQIRLDQLDYQTYNNLYRQYSDSMFWTFDDEEA